MNSTDFAHTCNIFDLLLCSSPSGRMMNKIVLLKQPHSDEGPEPFLQYVPGYISILQRYIMGMDTKECLAAHVVFFSVMAAAISE